MTNHARQMQTDTVHGNCWQTVVACILGVPADTLPDQVECEGPERKGHYRNALLAYLAKHHSLYLFTLQDWQIPGVRLPDPGLHVIVGPTERTAGHGLKHAVVGRHGAVEWDPHPSQAGLIGVDCWDVLVPFGGSLLKYKADSEARGREWLTCVCPACGGAPKEAA